MTARDVIASVVGIPEADRIINRLLSAPASVRLALAKQLLPDLKDYAQFKAEARRLPLPEPPKA